MQYRQGQQSAQAQLSQEQIQTWHHYAASLAKWADTPQKWDQAIDYLLQSNHPDISTQALMQLKGHFDPALRQSFMAMGGQQDDKPQEDPGIIREYDIANQRGLVPPGTTYEQYVAMRNPGLSTPVTVPYGATVKTPGQGGGIPRVTDQHSYDAIPPGTPYMDPDGHVRTKGGAGGNVSGGFPGQ
jgi:hypothetical protein